MFGDPGFLQSWGNAIILGFFFVLGLWILSMIFRSNTGKKAENAFYKINQRYENLPYNTRKFVGLFTFIVYCVGMVALLIWIES